MSETAYQGELLKKFQGILEERGGKALEMARKTILEEEIESKDVNDALKYFINDYWEDLFRPALLSIVCEAVGGDPNITTPIAISLSLISGGIDIHDDIIDQSKSKRSRPTVFGKFGKNVAIFVGDALLYKGFALLNSAIKKGISGEKIVLISDIIKKAFFEVGEAVAIELQFRERLDVSSEEYLRIIRKKAADVEAYTRISSILGNGSQKEIDNLSEYGRLLGMMQVLYADLSDMLDFEEFLNRIRNEHIPLQVIYALEKSGEKNELNLILQKQKKTKSDVRKIIKFTNEAEGPVFVAEKINSISIEATRKLQNIIINKEQLKLFLEVITPIIVDDQGEFSAIH